LQKVTHAGQPIGEERKEHPTKKLFGNRRGTKTYVVDSETRVSEMMTTVFNM
jgi:hypothetical protein